MSSESEMKEDGEFEDIPESAKTPVTIVTGFLGSGKVQCALPT